MRFLLKPVKITIVSALLIIFAILSHISLSLRWVADLITFKWSDDLTDEERYNNAISSIDELALRLKEIVNSLYGKGEVKWAF